ncbi:MAG: motility protein A [Candidatus Altimarinota bacterium]
MIGLSLGFVSILVVMVLSIGTSNLGFYLQPHSILVVIGGTTALLVLSTPGLVLKSLLRSISRLATEAKGFASFRKEIEELSRARKLAAKSRNPLINYAIELWEQGIDPDLFIVLLSQKKNELLSEQTDAVQSLKNLAKYPPALGMAGTVMGMISLFSSLDSKSETIGADLALAMTATFFGLILANALIAPLADRLQVQQVRDQRLYQALYEILLLINGGEPQSLVLDEVNSRAA